MVKIKPYRKKESLKINKEKIYNIFLLFILVILNILSGKANYDQLNKVYLDIKAALPENKGEKVVVKLKQIAEAFLNTQKPSDIAFLLLTLYELVERVINVYKTVLKLNYSNKELLTLNINLITDIISHESLKMILKNV